MGGAVNAYRPTKFTCLKAKGDKRVTYSSRTS